MPKNFAQKHHFILAKLLKFQETFLEKFLASGFGADAPTDNATQKSTAMPCFLICQNMLELRSKPPFLTFLERKVSQRTSHLIHQFILAKAFEVPRNFSRKVSCVGVWGGQPQHSTLTAKKHGNAVLFYIQSFAIINEALIQYRKKNFW